MAKIDLKHAYRSVPIHPDNFRATGCKWRFSGDANFTYFYDTRLPFGAKSSPMIFHRLTQSVRRMMARRGFSDIIVYLDDFLVIAPTKDQCKLAYDTLSELLLNLGFTISERKLVPPTQCLTFLGVELNTREGSMTLPQSKLTDLHKFLKGFQSKHSATKQQLQRLAGKLNWACRVVFGGRTFLRRIIDTMNTLTHSSRLTLDREFHSDIAWWVDFLHVFNGKRLFLNTSPTLDVNTDACPHSAGGFFQGDWFYHNFSIDRPDWDTLHINHKETLAIILAAKRWGTLWANQHVIIRSDNQAAVQIINKGTTANSVIMNELRALFWLSATCNFRITAVYLEGNRNVLADAISRLHTPEHLLNFYNMLCANFTQTAINTIPLREHMSADSLQFISSRCAPIGPGKTAGTRDTAIPITTVCGIDQSHLQNAS